MIEPDDVLKFWLRDVGPEGWYKGGEEIDARCRADFLDLSLAARAGRIESWTKGTTGTLAYLIVTDQLPRNIFRGTAEAFATDPQARAASHKALSEGIDLAVPEPERQFFYMPLEHSEDAEDQALAVRMMEKRLPSDPDMALHARAHQEIIRRFGRFPFRNAALGRVTTAKEQAFLDDGGYPALIKVMKA